MMKICVFSWPVFSHTNSSLHLMDKFKEKGVEIDYFGGEKYRTLIESHGLNFLPYTIANEEFLDMSKKAKELLEFQNKIHDKKSFLSYMDMEYKYLIKMHKNTYNEVIDIVKEINPDFIIRDACSVYGKMIAQTLNVKVIGYVTSLLICEDYLRINPLKNLPEYMFINMNFLSKSDESKIIDELIDIRNFHCEIENHPKFPLTSTLDPDEDINIIFSSSTLQPITNKKRKNLIAKPYIYHSKNIPPTSLKKEKIIYVSTGSYLVADQYFYNNIINAFKDTEYKLIISIPVTEDDLKLNLPQNVTVCKSVPQLEILSKTSLFITSGGYNSICESIYYNVPMLIYPVANDQLINASIIENLGIGMNIKNIKLTKNNLTNIASYLINNDDVLDKISQLDLDFKNSLSLEEVVNKILADI